MSAFAFLARCILLCSPLVLLVFCEILVLPINAFSFRLWEPLSVRDSKLGWAGPFYPNQKLHMVEEGDLAHGSALAVPKDVYWETDRQGFRNLQSTRLEAVDLVLVGDSMVVGASLTQADRLSDQLTEQFQLPSYAYAPGQLEKFFVDPRMSACKPKRIVFEIIERSLLTLVKKAPKETARWALLSEPWQILFSRLHGLKFPGYFQAEWQRMRLGHPPQGIVYPGSSMVFFGGEKAQIDFEPELVRDIVLAVKRYQQLVESKGMQFAFLPIPNKETIYYDQLPSQKSSQFLRAILNEARRQDIHTIDALSAFEAAKQADPAQLLYHTDDTHWNARGVRLVSELVAKAWPH